MPRLAQDTKPIALLVAEDDPEDRMLTVDALEECRFKNPLFFVENGEDLLDFLYHRGTYANRQQYPTPGLILLDLNMPRKDGREALREIKGDPALRTIPVVILTTSKAEEDIIRSYQLGVNSFIAKPPRFEGLVDVMQTISKYWLETVELP
ncbi:MAG: response regulator [Bacteroidia bacterium]|jgi:CheY-like chemotaxis protein|nr:response regulator [Bacteroidia bacterium]